MIPINYKIAVAAACDSMLPKAHELALRLNLSLVTYQQTTHPFILAVMPKRLELQENSSKKSKPIFVDFFTSQLTYRIQYGGGKKQLIAKAVGIKNKKNLTLLDATAGFGIDAFILASLGYEVMMLERSPIISALLVDGLEQLKKNPKSSDLKIDLQVTEAIDYLYRIIDGGLKKPDIIYLDPMYPKKNKTALSQKTMRILHEIIGDDIDAAMLLDPALKCAKNRVVVKRPNYASSLTNLKPNLQFSLNGSCRYDIYLPKNR